MAVAKKNDQKSVRRTNRIIIGVFVLILLLIPLILWFLGHNNKSSNLVSYSGNTYTFYYPKGWTTIESAMQNVNGTAFLLQPPNPDPSKTPHVYVEIAPANTNSIRDMTDAFHVFKYTETNTVVDGVNAQKYFEIVPSSEGVLHSIAYVFIVKGNIYLIKLGYKQQEVDSQLESQFTQIVTTFSAR